MKNQLSLTLSFLFLFIGMNSQAHNSTEITDPTASMTGSATICPGNNAFITITGTPNCVVTFVNDATPSNTYAVYTGANGTAIFTTPILNQTTLYTLVSIKEFTAGAATIMITGVSILITVIPSGCATFAISTPEIPLDLAICNAGAGECRTLVASPAPIASTTSYEVTSIPYCPQAPYYQPWYNQVPMNGDDIWSSPINLPFPFCFFNENYTSYQIGSNGLITFTPQTAPGYCFYQMNSMNIPNPAFIHLNAIFGALQDTDPRTSEVIPVSPSDVSINWIVTGTYPCRKLIVNFYHLGQYQCNQLVGLQTSQIVLHEVSNIIEVFIQNRTRCATFNNGEGVIGIINNNGILGYAPSGRNTADTWTATNEAWRFTPNGPNVPFVLEWLENGNVISNSPTTVVCPITTSTYVAKATYNVCGAPLTVSSAEQTLLVVPDATQNPVDLTVCHSETGNYIVDLTENTAIILGSLNPFEYSISFHQTLSDAQYGAYPFAAPEAYAFVENQTIYASITNVNYDCIYVKPFQLIISETVSPPVGITPQNFTPGQTLADLIVIGTNILWYDAPVNGNLLPISTLLEDGVTYYASQSNAIGCESRMSSGGRLAITAVNTLNTIDYNHSDFQVYPNPSKGNVTIKSTSTIESIEVYNTIGQQITKKTSGSNNVTVDLYSVSSGIYFLKITSNQKSQLVKIIKE